MGYEQADEHIQYGGWKNVKGNYWETGCMASIPMYAIQPFSSAHTEEKMKMDNLLKIFDLIIAEPRFPSPPINKILFFKYSPGIYYFFIFRKFNFIISFMRCSYDNYVGHFY